MNINPLYNVRETAVFSAGLAENRGRFKTLGKTSMEAEAKKDMEDFKKAIGVRSIQEYLQKGSPFATFHLDKDGQYVRPAGKQLVLFTDPKTQQRMLTHLTEDNLDKLKSKFGASDFYYRDDGIVRITGEAEELLGGWLQDIAYNQGYASADKNGDLIIDPLDDEGAELKIGVTQTMGYKTQNGKIVEIFAKETKSYLQGVDIFLSQSGKMESTFEERFNNFIEKDDDLDGTMTNTEYFGGKEKIIEHFQSIQMAHIDDKEEIIEGLENAIEAEHAFEELKNAGGKSSVLSLSARNVLSAAAPIYKDSLAKGEVFNKIELDYIRSDLDENIAKLLQLGGNQASFRDIVKHVHAVYLAKDENSKESALLEQLHAFLHMVKTDTTNATISLTA